MKRRETVKGIILCAVMGAMMLLVAGGCDLLSVTSTTTIGIANNTNGNIYKIFIELSPTTSWDRNLLEAGVLQAGSTFVTSLACPNKYNIKVERDLEGEMCSYGLEEQVDCGDIHIYIFDSASAGGDCHI